MAGKKYGLEDKYKMMYGGMTNPPVRASVGLFIKAGVAGAKKIARALAKSKDIKVGSTLNKARDVSKYDTRTLTDKGAFVKRRKELGLGMKTLPDTSSEFVKRRKELGLGMKALPDTSSEFVKRSLQLRVGPLTADTLKKSNKKLSLLQKFKKSIKDAKPDTNSEFVKRSLMLRAGSNSGKFSKTAKIGAIGGAGAVAIGAGKDLSETESFKKGREEGAKKSKELGKKIKNKAGKIVGYLTGKRMGGLQDEKLKPGAMYKASKGVMAKKNLKKAALVGAGLLASNYLGKRAGEADASRIALGIDKPETTSAFGVNINPTRFKEGGMYYKAKGGMHKANTGKLIGNQHKLDINKDGKISKEDFKMLKSKKKK